MKKVNLTIRCSIVYTIHIFFFTSMLMASSANSAVSTVTSKAIFITKAPVLDKAIIGSIEPQSNITSKLLLCQTNQLSLRRANVEGGMGHSGTIYILTNTSSSTCTLNGYPGFVLLDTKDREIEGVKVKLSKNNYFHRSQHQRVSLDPGNRASFMASSTHISQSRRNCASSVKVKITLPNAQQHFTIVGKLRSCDVISITPIEAGIIKH
jgi:hypothetical protein